MRSALAALLLAAALAPAAALGAQAPARLAVETGGNGSVTSVPRGIACPSACTASFPAGTAVSLTAEPGSGGTFGGWGGDCRGAGPVCRLVLTRAASVSAAFSGPRLPAVGGIKLGGRTWSGRAGEPLRGFIATFAGLAPAAGVEYRARVSWGDGRRSRAQVVWVVERAYAILAEHTYARPGRYAIVVRVGRPNTPGRVLRASAVVR